MRKCKTDGTHFSINIDNGTPAIGILISTPYRMALTSAELKVFRKRIHDALEGALAETFDFTMARRILHPWTRDRGDKFMVTLKTVNQLGAHDDG